MHPPFETFKKPTCRGSYALGTACQNCEKCKWEYARIAGSMTQQSNQGCLDELYKGSRRMIADLSEGRAGLNESLYDEGWNDCIDHLAQRGMLNCGWMPIESAPRDGTTINLYGKTKYAAFDHVSQGHWYKTGNKFIYHDYIGETPLQPTHWMPLPAAPKMEGK